MADLPPLFRWFCENCSTINRTSLAFYEERAVVVGETYVAYNDSCGVCQREVWDIRDHEYNPLKMLAKEGAR